LFESEFDQDEYLLILFWGV